MSSGNGGPSPIPGLPAEASKELLRLLAENPGVEQVWL